MNRIFILMSILVSLSVRGYNYRGYDFKVGDIYYNIISEELHTVDVTCGDKTHLPPDPEVNDRSNISDYEPFMWIGNSYKGDVVIPSTIRYHGQEYTVTAIGDGAFVRCDELISVTAPETVVSVGDHAFFESNVRKVNLSNNVVSFGRGAFISYYLESFDVPSSLETIPEICFSSAGYYNENFIIRDLGNLKRIAKNAFSGSSIKRFDINDTNISGSEDWGEEVFCYSKIEEIVLPSGWAEADYTDLMNKLFVSLPPELGVLVLDRTTPPSIDETAISVSPDLFSQVSLKVPESAVALYKSSSFWKRFINTTGVEDIIGNESDATIPTEYYRLDGVKVSAEDLPPIYIERKGIETRKCRR